jgi:O-methyltransferase involved in polyketide biosynthesis
MAKETTKERFPDRNNRENNRDNSDRRNFPNMGHPDRKRRPDNTTAMADKTKKFSKFRWFEDIENMHCIWHPQGNHTTRDCRIFIDRYARKGKNKNKRITKRKTKTTEKTKDSSSQRRWSQ